MKSNKKGQVGTTLNWFVAFSIIIFILFLYVIISGSLAGKKFIPLVGIGENEIGFDPSKSNIKIQRNLFYLLEYPLNEGDSIKNSIIKYSILNDADLKKTLEKNIESILDNDEGFCYLFEIDTDHIYNGIGNVRNLDDFDFSQADLAFGDSELNVKLYSVKC